MSDQIEILTEEASMEAFLRGFLPRILPPAYILDENCFIRTHSGKSHLMKSIPKKMRAYPNFPKRVRVFIIHDQDSNDCLELKNRILQECNAQIPTVVRIACLELENWYLGDLPGVELVYPKVNSAALQNKAKYRNPDRLAGSEEMKNLTKDFSKIGAAKKMGTVINFDTNRSVSFNQFVSGFHKLMQIP